MFAVVSVNRWRRERLDERRAEAAGRAYVALSRACDSLAFWADGCAAFLVSHRSDRPFAGEDFALYRSHNELGQRSSREALNDLRQLVESSSVYLDEPELKLLLEAEPIWQALRTDAAPVGATDKRLSDPIIDKMCARFDGYAANARALLDRGSVLRDVGRYRIARRSRTRRSSAAEREEGMT
ncbi:hypothetical protein [Anaeromyxobacter soli]|uniref:hypothetical protein n=1 Tax=Anaeromyxobacter soli TaxID=2922725 RepID=UPI001FAF3876|nr:hypothetical protein [Anaeromyxobacter sp. SG29]